MLELNLIPYAFIGDEPVRCEKCGKVLVLIRIVKG